MSSVVRNIVTPTAGGLFLACAVTGVALFFHINPGLFHTAHEWLGLVFVAVALWHVSRHWRSLASYAERPAAVLALALVVAASAGFTAATSSSGRPSPRAIVHALEKAPVSGVAAAFGMSPEEAVRILQAKGVNARPEQTLAEAARGARLPAVEVMLMLTGEKR